MFRCCNLIPRIVVRLEFHVHPSFICVSFCHVCGGLFAHLCSAILLRHIVPIVRWHLLSIDEQSLSVSNLDFVEAKEDSWLHLLYKSQLNRPPGSKDQVYLVGFVPARFFRWPKSRRQPPSTWQTAVWFGMKFNLAMFSTIQPSCCDL